MELKGFYKRRTDVETGTTKAGKEYRKAFMEVETGGQYSKLVAFSLWNDKTQMTDGIQPGQEITVHFDAESREFNGKYYTDLKCFKIAAAATPVAYQPAGNPAEPFAPASPSQIYEAQAAAVAAGPEEDLPF